MDEVETRSKRHRDAVRNIFLDIATGVEDNDGMHNPDGVIRKHVPM